MTSPTADAIRLAVKLSGHTQCQRIWHNYESESPCDGCMGDAATIDRELLLPEKHAALFAAQAVCDSEEVDIHMPQVCDTVSAISELRAELAKIKTP